MIEKDQPLQLFISYSHKDEEHLNELKTHLAVLERNKTINIWCDKELIAGDKLNEEIKNYLLEADLIVFLVSSDFLSSYNCYDVELSETLRRLENSEIRVLPTIVRACSWKETSLSEFVATTKDGNPITKFTNKDDAWHEVTQSIKKAAQKLVECGQDKNIVPGAENKISINSGFKEFLDDTEIQFNHNSKETIFLNDIYVYGDVKDIKEDYDELETTFSAEQLNDYESLSDGTLLLGAEQIGKTSLLKKLFESYFDFGVLPIFLEGSKINKSNILEITEKAIIQQYSDLSINEFVNSERNRILLIDNYEQLKLNDKYHLRFLNSAKEIFDKILVIADSSFKYNETRYIELSDFNLYEMLLFGHVKRAELIEKWNSIGKEETITTEELHNKLDSATIHLNSIIQKGIVPRKPFYIVTILQFLDTTTAGDFSLTSYGHCYQTLIQNQLKTVNINVKDYDAYVNYLEEMSFYIFTKGGSSITISEYEVFKTQYSEKYLIESHKKIFTKLTGAKILKSKDGIIGFGYRYFFYFYAAKYLSDHFTDQIECKKIVEKLCENIHTERNANVLIFLVHHSKDNQIIDEILLNAYMVFDDVEEASLDKNETDHILQYIATIPKLVMEHKDVFKVRKKNLEKKDEVEGVSEGVNLIWTVILKITSISRSQRLIMLGN